ncbi:MAG: hypothetical protein IPL61_40485 [Myxococcales bacterium]|nr:hypothetical protein [Myxococcales bacterium]
MKPTAVLETLEDAATQLGVRVSYEQLATAGLGVAGSHGGMCRVKGELRVIIDKRATPQERVATLASALARLDTDALKMAPKIRELLHFYAERPVGARPAPAAARAASLPLRRAS